MYCPTQRHDVAAAVGRPRALSAMLHAANGHMVATWSAGFLTATSIAVKPMRRPRLPVTIFP